MNQDDVKTENVSEVKHNVQQENQELQISTVTTTTTTTTTSISTSGTPKKKRGRPKKDPSLPPTKQKKKKEKNPKENFEISRKIKNVSSDEKWNVQNGRFDIDRQSSDSEFLNSLWNFDSAKALMATKKSEIRENELNFNNKEFKNDQVHSFDCLPPLIPIPFKLGKPFDHEQNFSSNNIQTNQRNFNIQTNQSNSNIQTNQRNFNIQTNQSNSNIQSKELKREPLGQLDPNQKLESIRRDDKENHISIILLFNH